MERPDMMSVASKSLPVVQNVDDGAFLEAAREFAAALDSHPSAANNGVAGRTAARVLRGYYAKCKLVEFDVRAALNNHSMRNVYESYLAMRASPIGKVLLSRDEAFCAMLVQLYGLLEAKGLRGAADKLVQRTQQKPTAETISAELLALTNCVRAEIDLILNPVWIKYLKDTGHVVELDFDALYDPTLSSQ